MALLEPIYEVHKPAQDPMFLDAEIPANIKPILELLQVRAVAFHNAYDSQDYWEISTANGMHYCRCSLASLGDDEQSWTEAIGHLLDYQASKTNGEKPT